MPNYLNIEQAKRRIKTAHKAERIVTNLAALFGGTLGLLAPERPGGLMVAGLATAGVCALSQTVKTVRCQNTLSGYAASLGTSYKAFRHNRQANAEARDRHYTLPNDPLTSGWRTMDFAGRMMITFAPAAGYYLGKTLDQTLENALEVSTSVGNIVAAVGIAALGTIATNFANKPLETLYQTELNAIRGAS